MKKWLLLFLLISSFSFGNLTLKQRLVKATPGDFIVTTQGSNYSVLLIRKIEAGKLVLEEIAIDHSKVDLSKLSWKKWIENKAPEASSWIALTIDLEKNSLIQCFSYLQRQFLFVEKSDSIFAQLLNLDLGKVKEEDLKRIGPAPFPGEADRRKIWKPELICLGEKAKTPHFEILRGTWADDKSRLANAVIELYLDADKPNFPFPYWIEIQVPHYTLKIRSIDSGRAQL